MRADRDPDLVLVETMLAPPPLEDARRSLEYWQRRRQALRLYQRRARREAAEMAARWEERVRAAERARFESTMAGRLLKTVGLADLVLRSLPLRKQRLAAFAWALVPRRLKLVAAGLVASSLVVGAALVTVLAAAVIRLA